MPANARAALQCRLCDATFARQEHLTRHLRTHTREKPYPCTQCSKSFSRQDVLNRHLIAHRHASRASATVSARACLECAANRVRCSKETPCQRCQDRQLPCLYPTTQTSQTALPQPQVASPGSVPADVIHVGGSTPGALAQPAPPFQQSTPRQLGTIFGASEGSLWPRSTDAVATYDSQLDASFNTNSFTGSGLSAVNWLSPEFQHSIVWEDFAMPFQDGGLSYETATWEEGGPVPSTSIQPAPWSQQTTTAATYIPHNDERQYPSHTQLENPGSDYISTSSQSQSQTSSRTSRTTSGALYVDGSAGRAPFGGKLLHKQTRDVQTSAQPESNDYTSPETETKKSLPYTLVSESAHHHLRQNITAHLPEWSRDNQHATHLQFHSIQNYVRSYFVQFHPAFPFIRKNSASFEGDNGWILLVGVAAVGAGYLNHAGHMSLLSLLDGLLKTLASVSQPLGHTFLKYRATSESRGSQLGLLQAGILHMILLIHNGNEHDHARGLLQRFCLSEQCKSLSLLSQIRQKTSSPPTVEPTESLANWLTTQSEIRTGLVLYLLDSLLSTEFGCARLFRLYDATSPLPSLEDIWAQPTLDRITKSDFESVTIADALEMLYMENRLPSNLSEFSKTILIHAVCRRVNEATYQHQESLTSWTPEARAQTRIKSKAKSTLWPPSDPILVRWRNSSCDCLDVLHWNANMISAGAGGWEHPTILHLHISRLFILTPVEDMQYVAEACPRVADGLRGDSRFEKAYTNIRRWALADQFKARLAIIHAGAILWHIRRYSINNFVEPFAAYLAILVVWNYSTSAIAYQRHASGNQQSRSESVNDDALSPSPTGTDDDEDPDPTFLHIDRPCDDEIVQAYVRKGQKMEANMVRIGDICSVGAPQKILREGLRLLSGDKSWTTRDMSSFSEPVVSRPSGLWGVKWSYVIQLADLARTTESW